MKNKILKTYEDYLVIDVSTPKFPNAEMLIDPPDWKFLQEQPLGRIFAVQFGRDPCPYAQANRLGRTTRRGVKIHRLLLPKAEMVDHRDHNGLNNRRKNIRACSRNESVRNRRYSHESRSGFRGVSPCKGTCRFMARYSFEGERFYLGTFATPEKAHEAILQKAKEIGADYIATGHHSKIEFDGKNKRYLLKKSKDENNNEVTGIGHSPRIGQETDEYYEIELENGEIIKCTENHPFFVNNKYPAL